MTSSAPLFTKSAMFTIGQTDFLILRLNFKVETLDFSL